MAEYTKREDAIDLFWAIDPENDGNDGCMIVLKCGNYDSNEIEDGMRQVTGMVLFVPSVGQTSAP